MTPTEILSWLLWIAPPAQAISAAVIAQKLTWKEQPALLVFLLVECGIEVLSAQRLMSREAAILIQLMCASGWLLSEMSRLSKIPIHPRTQAAVAMAILAACAVHAGIQPWTLDYKLSLFRSDVRIERALLALAILAFRWKVPAFERAQETRVNRVYRIGVTAYLVVEAIQGAFVKGGLGLLFLTYTPQRWAWVGLVTCGAVVATAVWTALAITFAAPGRKRAAIDARKGKCVVGRIDQQQEAA